MKSTAALWNPSTMMGTVSNVIRRKGFLFILDVEDKSRFVMAQDLAPCIDFDRLYEGVAVQFTPVSNRRKQNGLAAEAVHKAGCSCAKAVAA